MQGAVLPILVPPLAPQPTPFVPPPTVHLPLASGGTGYGPRVFTLETTMVALGFLASLDSHCW